MKILGEIIKAYRNEHKISLRQFADKCDLSHSYIDKLEKGIDKRSKKPVEPTLDALEKISKALGVTLDELLVELGKIKKYDSISKETEIIEGNLNKLNDEGKKEAIKRIQELTEINKYTASEDATDEESEALKRLNKLIKDRLGIETTDGTIPIPVRYENNTLLAAHNEDRSEEQQEKMKNDLTSLLKKSAQD